MKTTICLLLLFSGLACSRLFSQAMIFPGSIWYHSVSESFWNYNRGSMKTYNAKDTLIQNETWAILKKTYTTAYGLVYYLNEDILIRADADKVYLWLPGDSSTLLYNFSALPGDSWTTTIQTGNNSFVQELVQVDSVDSILINQQYLRRIFLSSPMLSNPYSGFQNPVTERFGSTGYIIPSPTVVDGPMPSLTCYWDNHWQMTKYTTGDCNAVYAHYGMSEDTEQQQAKIEVAQGWQSVTLNPQNHSGIFTWFNMTGKQLGSRIIQAETSQEIIPISQSGIIFWTFTREGERLGAGKLFFQP